MPDLPVLALPDRAAWVAWLEEHHGSAAGAWLEIGKVGSGLESVSYAEAVEERRFRQRFTPRGPRSIWSRINRDKAEALIAAGAMRPAGVEAVERARADGRWDAAYEGARAATVPDDLRAALDASPAAAEAFAGLDAQNRYAILHRTHTARRPETRARRIERFVAMLARGETIYPRR
jgi:uncharacterized protein YdeI (YjbR/CyaY-like superfamily)